MPLSEVQRENVSFPSNDESPRQLGKKSLQCCTEPLHPFLAWPWNPGPSSLVRNRLAWEHRFSARRGSPRNGWLRGHISSRSRTNPRSLARQASGQLPSAANSPIEGTSRVSIRTVRMTSAPFKPFTMAEDRGNHLLYLVYSQYRQQQ